MSDQNIVKFLFEMGQLKREPRAGWLLLGIKHCESVADHTCRTVFVSYILAKMEGADAQKTALISAFHEMGETRIRDFHKLASRYTPNKKEAEHEAIKDQLELLPKEIAEGFSDLLTEMDNDSSPEHIIAKDADYLECAFILSALSRQRST
jgi:putative hydrolases of HD superfamily